MYRNLITLRVVTSQDQKIVSGSLIDGHDERLVRIDQYAINTRPAGYLLIAPHDDTPGMVGKLGTILGENNINIGGMQVGREYTRGPALMIVNVDEPVPPLPSHTPSGEPVPQALAQLTLRCLAKEPGDRPQQLAEVITALLVDTSPEAITSVSEDWRPTQPVPAARALPVSPRAWMALVHTGS